MRKHPFGQRLFHLFLLSLCAAMFLLPAEASSPYAGQVVRSCGGQTKKIALTFDDGPHPVYTPEILDILASYDIPATFFVIGENITYYDGLLELEAEAGHEIGNHTYSHPYLHEQAPDVIREEIRRTEELVEAHTGRKPHLLRPPGGLYEEHLCPLAEENGYTVVCWSVDTRDWAHTPPEEIAQHVLNTVQGGDIILFHDFVGGEKSPTPEALRMVLPVLLERGYEFVTVSALLGLS